MREGSCFRGEGKCKFSHKISPEQRADESFIENVRKIKDEKASKCINEFNQAGSCTKGLFCPFSHNISDNDRQNKLMKKKMADKRSSFHNNKTVKNTSSSGKEVNTNNSGSENQMVQLMSKVIELLERNSP